MKKLLLVFTLILIIFKQVQAQDLINTIAGNGTQGFSGDGGTAVNAMLDFARGVAVDGSGNIYIADGINYRIRKVTPSGIITTYAGNGTQGHSGDGGSATVAQLSIPAAIAVDVAGNLFICDNQYIRKVNTAGIISTVAGIGTPGYSGDGGLATAAQLNNPYGVAVDNAGNIYIADYSNVCVRKVSATTGIITTIAGTGIAGYSGDGGLAVNAELNFPQGVAVDASNNIFICDQLNNAIRKINTSGIISTFAGPSTGANLNNPTGIAVDKDGNIFIADRNNYKIRKLTSSGVISTSAGNGNNGFSGDGGLATNAQLTAAWAVAVDAAGNQYIADQYRIRKVGNAVSVSSITALEYFIDIDPGVGTGISIPISPDDTTILINYSIPLNGIASGTHNLFVRAKTNLNLWSIVDQRTFYVNDTTASTYTNNTKVEYYIDTDPGVGSGNNVPVSANDTINLTNFPIPTTGLANGIHNLYVRAKTSNNLWNVIDQRTFYVEAASTNAVTEITKLEYFFDTDPGVGNATDWDISTLPPDDTITFTNANRTVPCLSNGQHFLYLRAKNNLGVWSVIDFDTITVSGGIAAPLITANGATTFCAGGNVVLSTLAQGDLVYQWFNNGDTIIGQTTSTITVTLAGSYTLKITCNGNIIISNSITVVTNTPTTWYRDNDLDNFGDVNTTLSSCIQPSGYILNNTDCNDANSNVHPLATELCDALDNDCNTIIDDISAPFSASISASNASVCPGENVTLNAFPTGVNYVYQWSTGETTASIAVLNNGTYTVTITNSNTLCNDNYSIVLNAGSTPLVTAFNSGPYCSGNTIQLSITGQNLISYVWSGPNNYISSQASPSIANATVANGGNYSVIVTATDGCTGTASTGVVVYALPSLNINQLPVAPVCPGIDIALTANAPTAISYLWNNNSTSSSRIVNTSGNYAVTVTDANSCSASASYTVAYDPVIEITPNNISAICSGASLTFHFNNSVSTLWSTGANTPSITVSPTTTTNYTVQGTSAAGCVYYDTLLLWVEPNTVQTVSNLIPSDNSFNLNATIDFSWAPAPDASEYDLYVWKAINSRPVIPTVANAANITAHVGGLSYGTDYLWQVFSKNSCAVAESDTQHFSTVPLPDLIVDSVNAPTSAFSHSNISVTWRVTNTGLGPTGSSYWYDQVHLSVDSIFDPADDPKVGEFGNLSFLNSGESYLRTESVFIPVNYVGTYYLFVVSDLQVLKSFVGYVSNVLESNEINNSLAAPSPIAISVPAAPDLIVTSVGAPTSAFGLDSISVTYTVKNRYPTTANGNWAEAIFVSVDSNFNVSNATLLRLVSSPVSTLLYDSTYTKIVKVQLPDSIYGTKWLHVVTDYTNVVFEATTENNNSGTITAPLQVTLYPPADLASTAINAPSAFSSGQTINVSYTVENQGAHTPIVNYWIDKVYLSSMSTFDVNASVLLKTITYSTGTTLNPGNTYTKQNTVNIPNGISGTYYLYVFTDAGNNVFEYTYTANNILRSSALNVSLTPYPDLVVSSLTVTEDTVMSGTLFNLAWTISNQGTAPTDNSWKDNIGYFTSTNTSVGGTDFVTFSSTTSSLLNGNSTSRNASIVAPTFSGSVKIYFLMKTDALNSNYEYQFENNNFSVLDSLVVLPIPVPPCDLIIDASTSPGNANSGQPISLSWTAHNAGPDSTKATYWNDIVYLSTDQLIDAFDYKLCNVQHPGALQSNQSYTVNSSGTIPNGYSGNYYLLFKVDNYNSVYNDQNFNNTLHIVPINIQLTPSADLIVSAVSVPAPLYAGQSVYLHYTVKNNGPAVMPSVSVSDRGFISNSPTPNGVTHQLAATSNVRSLSVNQTYTDSVLINIPIYLSGNKYLILKTDNRDSVYEYTNEGNNFGSLAVNILPAPIYDLQISQLQLPSSLLLGQDVRIPYTITNSGTIPVSSTVKNAAYYSIDNQYSSATDPVLATRNALLSLAPGASLIDTFDTKVKDVNAGNYFGVGRTNILNTLLETSYGNNTTVTGGTTAVDAESLTLNVTDNNQLNSGDLVYYKVTVGFDLDMLITLTSDNQSAFNEMYVAYNRTPSGTDYDFRHQSQNKANQRVLVPATQAGTYYILIKTSTLTPNPQNINVLAVTLPFSLLSITPNHLGQGIVTTVIDGAGFRQGMHVYLKDGSTTIAQGTITEFTSSMSVKVRWDLTNVAIGSL
jgi:sugar lactone lactonase YvrE